MGRIFCLMGKSASGKDTIYSRLLHCSGLCLKPVVPYTTRPIRAGEIDGENYFFRTPEEAEAMQREGRIIEMRTYQTVQGPWQYFTADDGQIDLNQSDYLMISTPDAFIRIRDFFGRDRVIGIYIWTEDGLRLSRALERERRQKMPNYSELCRRYLADEKDFSEEKLQKAGITERFENDDLDRIVEQIAQRIRDKEQQEQTDGGIC